MKERQFVADMVKDVRLPKMFRVKQTFERPRIEPADVPGLIETQLRAPRFAERIRPGMKIAITAGSRGVANVALITRSIAAFVRSRGAYPFVVPAMGSHGGATAEGQREILNGYGITEEYVGCPIRSSMEVVKIGVNDEGTDVYIDKNAAGADGIIISCRVKPHTSFRGPYESGLMKMMAIGLGKQYGAEICHAAGYQHMAKNIPLFGRAILKHAPVLFGFAAIENAFDETCRLEAVAAEAFEEQEPLLLREAFARMPRILVDSCDVLVVDRIGKNYSGEGMDPNITGTFSTPYASGGIRSQRVCVLDITPESHGNGVGIGCASVTTKRLFQQLDLGAIYSNAITSTVLDGARIPVIMESDREAIQLCIKTCTDIDHKNPRIVRIPNSLHLEHIMLSEAYSDLVRGHPDLTAQGDPEELAFDSAGNLW